MTNVQVLQEKIEHYSPGQIAEKLQEVAGWPTYPTQSDSFLRQAKAREFLQLLQGPDGAAYVEPARLWLVQLTYWDAALGFMGGWS